MDRENIPPDDKFSMGIIRNYMYQYLNLQMPVMGMKGRRIAALYNFVQLMHCERHITTTHSGFAFQFTICLNLLARTDQKHKFV